MSQAFFTPDGGEPINLGEVNFHVIPSSSKIQYQPIGPIEEVSAELEFKVTAMLSKKIQDHHDDLARGLCWDALEAEGWRELNAIFATIPVPPKPMPPGFRAS